MWRKAITESGAFSGAPGLAAAALGAVAATGAGAAPALAALAGVGAGLAAQALVARLTPFSAGPAPGALAPLDALPAIAPPSDAPPSDAPPSDALPPGVGRALLERLPLGLLLIDEAGRVMFQNAAALEIIERPVLDMPAAAALRTPALAEAVTAAFEGGQASELDVTLLRGMERVIHATVRPLAREGEVRPLAREPSPQADQRAPTVLVLLEDRTRAAKAEALRRDFVANASHELKTPLASISGFIETLQGHARNDPDATERFLAIMARQAERMKRLVEDLLSLNRIEINEHVRPRDPVSLATLVREVAAGLAPQAAAEGAEIAVALPQAGLIVPGSRDELVQVFVNLLDNAIKYAGDGGPIRVLLADPDSARPGMVGVTVADGGPGVPREHIPRLTERFYRVDVARSRSRGGTGLGLAIVKHILSRHRGDLTIASAPGVGAQFTVWLPARAAPPTAAAAPQATPAAAR